MFARRPTTAILAFAAACLVLSACDDDDNGTEPSTQATTRFTNAMTGGTGSLGLSINGGAQGSAVAYQNYGNCQQLAPGSTNFSIAQSGSTTALVTIPSQNLTANTKYTIVALGSTTTPTAMFLTDTYTTPSSGRARLRIINAVNVTTPFDVYVSAPGTALGTANMTNVAFNTSQSFLDVPTGQTQVRVTIPGTQTVIGTSGTFTLNSGDVTTLVVTPSATVGGTLTSFLVPECQ